MSRDPVIPEGDAARQNPDLHRKLTAAGASTSTAKGVCVQMGKAAAAAADSVRSAAAGWGAGGGAHPVKFSTQEVTVGPRNTGSAWSTRHG